MAIGVVVVDHFMNLPKIKMVGLQTPQRLFELPHGHLLVAAVGADLRHQEHTVASPAQRLAHPLLAAMIVVLPGIVHERDAGINRFVKDPRRLGERTGHPQGEPAQTHDGDSFSGAAEGLVGNFVGPVWVKGNAARGGSSATTALGKFAATPAKPASCKKRRRSGWSADSMDSGGSECSAMACTRER